MAQQNGEDLTGAGIGSTITAAAGLVSQDLLFRLNGHPPPSRSQGTVPQTKMEGPAGPSIVTQPINNSHTLLLPTLTGARTPAKPGRYWLMSRKNTVGFTEFIGTTTPFVPFG